jgi:SAM-dependent methyltransferase
VTCRLLRLLPTVLVAGIVSSGALLTGPQSCGQGKAPDVIFVPTPHAVVDKMLELADPRSGEVLYDLGCGDGRICVAASKKYGIKSFGWDIDPARVQESLKNVEQNNLKHLVTIKQGDIFELDLSGADVITLYLLPHLNVKLIPQLDKLKPGCRIVSHDFDMKGVTPKRQVTVNEGREHVVYLWVTPMQKDLP